MDRTESSWKQNLAIIRANLCFAVSTARLSNETVKIIHPNIFQWICRLNIGGYVTKPRTLNTTVTKIDNELIIVVAIDNKTPVGLLILARLVYR